MATVTVGKIYFEALLRRAEFHLPDNAVDTTPSLSNNVVISKAEHDYLLRAVHEYNLLKNALFQGGLTVSALETLLSAQTPVEGDPPANNYQADEVYGRPQQAQDSGMSPNSDHTAVSEANFRRAASHSYNKDSSYDETDEPTEMFQYDEKDPSLPRRAASQVQRTILITGLADRTTHKDIVSIVRGGRLLDIRLWNDRSATVSFAEGAAEFLAYTKRNDIYLHSKRLEFSWNDWQFRVAPHVAKQIAIGASRNLVVRGGEGKLTERQIRDHLDHIHNLIVVNINFQRGDAHISLNSVHNALFAKTCMKSRTAYKNLYVGWHPDECATPLPPPTFKTQKPAPFDDRKLMSDSSNPFSVLESGSDDAYESDGSCYITRGVHVNHTL